MSRHELSGGDRDRNGVLVSLFAYFEENLLRKSCRELQNGFGQKIDRGWIQLGDLDTNFLHKMVTGACEIPLVPKAFCVVGESV